MLQDSRQTRRDVRRVARRWGRPTWRRIQSNAHSGDVIIRRRLGRYVVEIVAEPVRGWCFSYVQFHAGVIGVRRDSGYGWDVHDLDELGFLFGDVAQGAEHADTMGVW